MLRVLLLAVVVYLVPGATDNEGRLPYPVADNVCILVPQAVRVYRRLHQPVRNPRRPDEQNKADYAIRCVGSN